MTMSQPPGPTSLRYDILTWLGLAGSSVSLFSKLGGIIEMSRWARAMAAAWTEWAHAATNTIGLWLGLGGGIPRELAVLLSFAASAIAAILGVRWKAASRSGGRPETSLSLPSPWLLPLLLLVSAALAIASLWAVSRTIHRLAPLHSVLGVSGTLVVALLAIAWAAAAPIALLARDRAAALGFVAIFAPVPVTLAQIPLLIKDDMTAPVADAVALASWLGMVVAASLVPIALYLAPARDLSRRFVYVIVGLILLIALDRAALLAGG